MTDATPTPPPAPTPAAADPKQTLSLVGFILGIGSVIFSWTGIIGIGAGIAAIIVSRKGAKEEPGAPKWMSQVGLITGIVGIILGLILGIITLVSVLLPLIFIGSYGSVLNSY
jgi:hypothetical protein